MHNWRHTTELVFFFREWKVVFVQGGHTHSPFLFTGFVGLVKPKHTILCNQRQLQAEKRRARLSSCFRRGRSQVQSLALLAKRTRWPVRGRPREPPKIWPDSVQGGFKHSHWSQKPDTHILAQPLISSLLQDRGHSVLCTGEGSVSWEKGHGFLISQRENSQFLPSFSGL